MPDRIGPYELLKVLVEKSTIIVGRGSRISDGKVVIIKILKPSPNERDAFRLKHEFAILSNLKILGVIKVYSMEESEQGLIMALEDIGGESLEQLLAGGKKLPLERFLDLASRLAETIAGLHDQRITHKDINPSHIIVNTTSGELRLIGFGSADEQSQQTTPPQAIATLEGTLEYMSPEQTGRMNRVVDYRTDFYSLGVTFYQILTGQLPFVAPDALGIIHQHIAAIPADPHQIEPAIPRTLSRIVLKLMAKMADDRYQNAWGLKADLDRCLQELRIHWTISDFEPGSQDFSDRLRVPQKLYGRDKEMKSLLAAFGQVFAGEKKLLLLVAGYAGVGKTRLVREMQRTVLEKQGYFIEGKFDQLQRAEPYWGWSRSFKILTDYLLMENELRLTQWKRTILKAVGNIGKVLTDVIPGLELIIGPQPPVPELGGAEAQNRFNYVFLEFVKAIADKEHPLIIFLDDLQWIDIASLRLLQIILTDSTITHVLIIGAYRDNEMDASNPLTAAIESLRKENANIELLTIRELTEKTTNKLIADILRCSPAQTASLTRLIYSKTGGNPFFIIQTITTLVEKRVITFNAQNHSWRWDNSDIENVEITDNIVALMVGKIRQLEPGSRHLLPLAACVGFQFRISYLSIIAKQSENEILEGLRPALHDGLISADTGQYQFVHDRVQQASYSLISDTDKIKVHLEIGRLLLDHLSYRDHDEQLFTVVDHLNIGSQLIKDADEKSRLARLNLLAGRKARNSGAFLIATRYLEVGLNLLDKESWANHYELTLELHTLAAEAQSFHNCFDIEKELFDIVTRNARSAADMVGVYESIMQCYVTQGLLQEIVVTGLDILEKLGLSLPPYPTAEEIHRELTETKSLYTDVSIESLMSLPQLTDRINLAILRIVAKIAVTAYSNRPALCQLIVLKAVRICITKGNSIFSPYYYALYAFICMSKGEMDSGYRFGKLANILQEERENSPLRAKTLQTVNAVVWHFVQHLRTTLPGLEAGYQSGLETGDLEYAGHNALTFCRYSFFAGMKLQQLEAIMASYDNRLQRIRGEIAHRDLAMVWQATQNLLGLSENPCLLVGKCFDKRKMLPILEQTRNHTALASLYLNQLILCYLFRDYQKAFENAELLAKSQDAILGMFSLSVFNFYDSLTRLQVYSRSDESEQPQILEKVSSNQRELRHLANHAPMNQLHRFYLVEAERLRVTEQDLKAALNYYDRAIYLAGQNEYIQEEALANELAARFWLERGKDNFARIHMKQAHHGYSVWGAVRKVKDLEERYASLLVVKPEEFLLKTSGGTSLDLSTVMKATHAVSSEIEMNRLLNQVMHIVIENAGAQHGYLLTEEDGIWMIIAEGEVSQTEIGIPVPVNIDEGDSVSPAVVHFVARTKTKIVLDNAALQGEFVNDPHIRRKNTRSLLCAPLLHRGKLISILYLENNLTTNAFTPERVQFLEMLLSQMAISLENASIYEKLRKSELKYRLIVETAREGVLVIGPDAIVSFANSRMAAILGFSPDELLKKPVLDFVPEEDRPDLEKRIETRRHGIAENYELRLLRKDRHIVWAMISAVPLFNDQKCYSGAFAMVTDITERKQAEDALRAKTEELDRYFNESLDLLCIADTDGYFRRLSREWEATLGYPISELVGKRFLDFVHPDDRDATLREIGQLTEQKNALNFTIRYLSKNGSYRWIEWRAFLSGKRIYAVARDITDRKLAEEALRESESSLKSLNENLETIVKKRTLEVRELSKALTVAEQRERQRMSHLLHEDLLQILLSTNMRISMLSEDVENIPEIRQEVNEVKQMNLRAINSTNALSVEFNPPILKREGLDVALKWLIRHFRNQYGLEVNAASLDPCREMDPDIRFLLVQLVRELFLNIVKHAKTNKAIISVRCSQKMMRLFVRDRGVGFDVNKASEAAKVREFVGLFSIEERLKLIGGCIKIVSVPGKGTIVRIVVPIEVSFLKVGGS